MLEFIRAETARAGLCHASIRHIAGELNLQKNTAQRRITALLESEWIERVRQGGMRGSAAYRITENGLAALDALARASDSPVSSRGSAAYTERTGTWYVNAPVPDAMRSQALRGPWELWRSAPHQTWLSPAEALAYVSVKTARSVRNWVTRLADLEIPLAEWEATGSHFRLLDADSGVLDQLRFAQEEEAVRQGRWGLLAREDLRRSYLLERIRADEAIEQRKRRT